jgi:hypothetical protein
MDSVKVGDPAAAGKGVGEHVCKKKAALNGDIPCYGGIPGSRVAEGRRTELFSS